VFKVIAAWSHPKPEDVDAFETHYLNTHVPLAKAVPELRRIVLTRTGVGLEGAQPAFHRIAEMAFDDPEALERSADSAKWKALREDAGVMIGKFGVKLEVGIGWEDATSLGGGFDLGGVDRLLGTTRAVRRRLDPSRPVPRGLVLDCLRLSQQAPTASNQQTWRWIVVDDAAKRRELGALYAQGIPAIRASEPTTVRDAQTRRVYDGALWLAEHLGEMPVLAIPCVVGRLPADAPLVIAASVFGSIYQAVWSFQLALRSRGLGSTFTTMHLLFEDQARKLLGLPDDVMQAALLPVAYTKGGDFKPAARPPVETIVRWNGW